MLVRACKIQPAAVVVATRAEGTTPSASSTPSRGGQQHRAPRNLEEHGKGLRYHRPAADAAHRAPHHRRRQPNQVTGGGALARLLEMVPPPSASLEGQASLRCALPLRGVAAVAGQDGQAAPRSAPLYQGAAVLHRPG